MERNLLYNEIGSVLRNSLASLRLRGAAGTIHYVDLSATKLKFPNSAIYIPENFRIRENTVDIILYFHGLIIPVCSGNSKIYNKLGMKSYLENNKYFENLCPKVSASGKNGIFIAVTWMMKLKKGKYEYEGRRGHRNSVNGGEFNGLVDSCIDAINRLAIFATPASRIDVGNIILAGHSAGGAPMQRIINDVDGKTGQRYLSKIKECWGFDSQYSSAIGTWENWLTRNPDRVFKHFSVGNPQPRKKEGAYPPGSIPFKNISNLWISLRRYKTIAQNRYSFIEGKTSHCAMVDKWFVHCLESSPNISAIET
jgi:hypothetical protein